MSDRQPKRIEYKPDHVVRRNSNTFPVEAEEQGSTPERKANPYRKRLIDICPEITKYWDYEKNSKKPEEYAGSSSEKVYTFCPQCGVSLFRAVRFSRRDSTDGVPGTVIPCKKCSKHDDSKTLVSLCPDIINYWVHEKNGLHKPASVMARSAEMIYIRCPGCGKELCRPAYSCIGFDPSGSVYVPLCNNCAAKARRERLLQTENNLLAACPEIERYWSKENGEKRPEDFTKASLEKIYIKCPGCGKVLFRSVPNSLARNEDGTYSVRLCQKCGSRAKLASDLKINGGSVAQICPVSVDWWDYEKNDPITPEQVYARSNDQYYFKCPRCGESRLVSPHKFLTQRRSGEVVPQDCPVCGYSEKTIDPALIVSNICPEIKQWWNYEKNAPRVPEEFTRGSTYPAYLTCPVCGVELHSFIRDAVTIQDDGSGVMTHAGKCDFLRTLANEFNLTKVFPDITNYWDYEQNALPPERYTIHSNDFAYFKCPDCGRVKYKRISDSCRENVDGSYPFRKCEACELDRIKPISFGALYPELAKELLDEIDPFTILPDRYLYAKWKCSVCGLTWNAHVHDRVMGERPCPYCAGFLPIPGKTSLAALYPDLVEECVEEDIDYDAVFPSHTIAFAWKCPTCDMTWKASPKDRVSGETSCPYCDGRKAIPGRTSFAALFPELASECVDDIDLDAVLPTYTLPMRWRCSSCDMIWKASPKDRVSGEASCPYCDGRKAIPGKTSLAAKHPALMAEWLTIENTLIGINPDSILPKSPDDAWWMCPSCHSKYTMPVGDRVMKEKRGHNPCPYCNGRRQKRTYFV